MKIGLIDIDGHNFPNLCLMKISAWYKSQNGTVEWWNPDSEYDVVYGSKVFTESTMPTVNNADKLVIGGSGVDLDNKLPDYIEHQTPDYSIYPQYDFALGFLTRGCPRVNHTFCITPKKDGVCAHKVANLSEFWTGQKNIVLLDQNLLACWEDRINLLNQLAESKAKVEFNGGMDVRFLTDEIIDVLRKIKVKDYHFAWDDPRENLLPKFQELIKSELVNPNQVGVYVLTNFWSTHEEDLYRIQALRSLGLMPFVMIYDKQKFVDKSGRWLPGAQQKYSPEQLYHFKVCQHMQRWCGNRAIIKSCPNFNDYEPFKKMGVGGAWGNEAPASMTMEGL